MPPPGRRRGGEEGQATLEVVGLTLLVAVLLAAVVASAHRAGVGSGIAETVRRDMVRAVCLAGLGTNCRADQAACVTSSDGHTYKGRISFAVIRLGADRGVLVQRRSDGTFQIDEVGHIEGGGTVAAGSKLHGRWGDHSFAIGASAAAALLAHAGATNSWSVRSDADAQRVTDALTDVPPRRPDLAPTSVAMEGGLSASFDASVGDGAASASLGASAKAMVGARIDRATGNRTYYLHPGVEAHAAVTLADVQGSAGAGVDEVYAVTVDRAGRPVDLSVVQSGALQAGVALAPDLQAALAPTGRSPDLQAKRMFSVERHLDLSTPDARTAALAFLRHVVKPDLLHPRAMIATARDVAGRLARSGTGVGQVHAVDEGGVELDGQVSLEGVTFGIGGGRVTESSRLLAATARGPDGAWYRRDDCAPAPAA